MSDIKSKNIASVRKRHQCDWCDEWIEKGDAAHYRYYEWCGDMNSEYLHPECYLAMQKFQDPTDLGYTIGEFKRGSVEER